jgi:isocitrate dehydrogenase kinase/phosphatase
MVLRRSGRPSTHFTGSSKPLPGGLNHALKIVIGLEYRGTGRVVFYDYDELCFLTDCNFREIPQARSFDDEFEAQPWYFVDERDIFPVEFKTFLGLSGQLMNIFEAAHQDLFEVEFWQKMQARHRAGETIDIFPYPHSKRLLYRAEPVS